MVLIFLLLFTSYSVAMDDNVNDGPFTPKHFDAFLKKVDDQKLQTYQKQQKKIVAAERTARVINIPPIITRTNRQGPVPTDDNDKDDYGTTASNSSPRAKRTQTDSPLHAQEPVTPAQDTDRYTALMHCFIAECDWCLRYDPTLQGTQEGQQFLELVDEMFFHCHQCHWTLGRVINYVDTVMKNPEQQDDTQEDK